MVREYSNDDLIALVFLVVGALAFYEAYTEFPYEEGVFPMIASGIMVFAAAIWLLRSFLPGVIYSALIEFEESREIDELVDDASDGTEAETEEQPAMYKLILLSGGYVGVAYLIGFLWATPVFVTAYGLFRKFDLKNHVVINAIAFLVVFSFAFFTTVPIDQGALWGYRV